MTEKFDNLIYLINLLLFINQVAISSSALSCKISVPDTVTSQKLNNIICIGASGFTYSNFATFSDGSLLVECSRDIGTIRRSFYGITLDGKPFFKNNQYHMSLNSNNECYRKESENSVITLNDNAKSEYLMSVGNDLKVEVYDLNSESILYTTTTSSFIDSKTMDSEIQTFLKYSDGSNNYLFHCYLTSECYLRIRKLKFTSANPLTYSTVISKYLQYIYGKIASCYMTVQYYIVCLTIYSKLTPLVYAHLYATVYDINLNQKVNSDLDYLFVPTSLRYLYFLKCIHLKDEIGIAAFYRAVSSKMVKTPVLLFLSYSNSKITNYISAVELNKKEFSTDCTLNDIIKINEKKVVYFGTSESKEVMYIVLIIIYDNTNVAIRYYDFNIYSLYTFKFYLNMRGNVYNNFIAFAFCFCRQDSCSSSSDKHYPGFMIFNYPNGTDYSIDHIDNLITNNAKIDNYTINLHNKVKIENNIFGLVYSHINIKQYLDCGSIKFYSSVIDYVVIVESYNLGEEENIVAKEFPLDKTDCSIVYTYMIEEPSFDEYNSYVTTKVFPTTYTSAKFEAEKETYESRLLYYNISISQKLSDSCDDENCLVCRDSDKTKCIICKFNYVINRDDIGKYKNCIAEGIEAPTQAYLEETEPPTTIEEENNDDDDEEKIEGGETTNKFNTYFTNKETISEKDTTNTHNTYTTNKVVITGKETTSKINKNYLTTDFLVQNIPTDSNECSYDDILTYKCGNGKLNNTQISDLYDLMRQKYIIENYDGQPKVISTENVIYQISTFEYQKNSDEPNISSIDLGTCESRLKGIYNISDNDSLIMLKMDYYNEEYAQTYVYYEIYDPYEHNKLNISFCDDLHITISTPVDLDDNSIILYESLLENGYNIFDSSDDFYNDICATYTTVNGTDMLIEDRKKNMYSTTGNINMCQSGCNFVSYNTTTKKSVCDCEVQTETVTDDISNIEFSTKQLASEFLGTIKNSNFRVLKCYKLAIDTKKLFKNIGRIIMTLFFVIYLISLFCYIIKERKKIDTFINLIIKSKENSSIFNFGEKSEKIKIKSKENKKEKEKKSNSKKNDNAKTKTKSKSKTKTEQKKKSKTKSKSKPKNKGKNFPPRKRSANKNKNRKKNDLINSTKRTINTNSPMSKSSDDKKISINIYPISNVKLKKTEKNKIYDIKGEKSNSKMNNEKTKNKENYEGLNDEELNSLEYNIAVFVDKRTYFQYYWSLLKKKQLILFTVLPANDYNLFSLKVGLFILSFSLYFTINGFFFDDSTMHKVTESNGKYDIIYQIPQILYSSIISAIINMLLKKLSLSEKSLLSLKQEKDLKRAKKISINIRRCIIVKFIIFFILSNILLLFFWYFISCFCAVYTNTQTVLIKDTMISFCLSMLYPFGINLLPGFLRIPALRDEKKNSKYMYNFSGYIALI